MPHAAEEGGGEYIGSTLHDQVVATVMCLYSLP